MYDFHNIALAPAESLLLNAAILSVIVFALLKAERRLDEGSGWIMLALLAVFAFAGRILFEPLPNIQPVTLIVLLAGIYLGSPRAFALAGVVALSTNVLVLGHGPWTLFQVIGWGAVGEHCGSAFHVWSISRTIPIHWSQHEYQGSRCRQSA